MIPGVVAQTMAEPRLDQGVDARVPVGALEDPARAAAPRRRARRGSRSTRARSRARASRSTRGRSPPAPRTSCSSSPAAAIRPTATGCRATAPAWSAARSRLPRVVRAPARRRRSRPRASLRGKEEREESMAKLNINGKVRDVQVEADTPLLWVIREQVGLTGTKYGCGVAQCGACSVHINGEVLRSCVVPGGQREGRPTGSSPSKACRPPARIRCRRRGPRSTCRNAATASRARSWRRRRCCKRTRSRPTRTSTRR